MSRGDPVGVRQGAHYVYCLDCARRSRRALREAPLPRQIGARPLDLYAGIFLRSPLRFY
jgi:hypothetical protein